ncbi:MAG: F0F1 ATP synthase subunit delta [Arenimonas sp.]|nr:F0F1 ATP synthase subunit delta [Arenimonas sp.]
MSHATTLARPYARALFMLANESKQVKSVSEALSFSASAAVVPELASLLGNPRVANEQLLDLLSHPELGASLKQFLSVLAENNRLALLPEIAVLFEQLVAESEHVIKANITSATPLSEAELAKLSVALKNRFGREVEIQTAVDASLIGGAIIDTGDLVIDGSVRNKLARLQADLAN